MLPNNWVSLKAAAKQYSVTRNTLRGRLSSMQNRQVAHENQQHLSVIQEHKLEC